MTKSELKERISEVMHDSGVYHKLHLLLVDEAKVLLHSDMDYNFGADLERYIFNWTYAPDVLRDDNSENQ
jgi:hypothetical protein